MAALVISLRRNYTACMQHAYMHFIHSLPSSTFDNNQGDNMKPLKLPNSMEMIIERG